ncbi:MULTISPECIES: hypothetical protein [unclassified Arcicella]|uniref:hypothetical protein n=1 Tax=unclassified Arcicella TaxID=2644986 RepID=UPI002864D93D|nr:MULTISPECIES: hypothetical protein [unclassified Arcicella]MDR6560507.1 hypothetical protein [Arcicella sp. BE51]MDR6809887.1 hypothetical protein [Arcicella sp. BE140]MDR6821236.1 hypothetical protein [Arcicella sp. BE139]
MKKAFIKYPLFLCVLLLSLTSQLFAQTHKEAAFHLPKNTLEESQNLSVSTEVPFQFFFSTSSLDGKGNTFFAYDEENIEEEESFVTPKKNAEAGSYFTIPFFGWYTGFTLLDLPQVLLFCKHYSPFFSVDLNIVFCVFRI